MVTCSHRLTTRNAMSERSAIPADNAPRRGEVWFTDLNPTRGHEQAGRRPILVISSDSYNINRSGLVIALPLTSRVRAMHSRVPVHPPEGGLKVRSDILCHHIRALSQERLLLRWNAVAPATLTAVENALRSLLRL